MVAISRQWETQSSLKAVFQQVHAKSCPRNYNFHMHTTCSDGQLEPEALIQQAIAIGLQGLAITDHHTVAGYRIAVECLAAWGRHGGNQSLPTLWSGVEISADLLDNEVHILAYGFDPDHLAIAPTCRGGQ